MDTAVCWNGIDEPKNQAVSPVDRVIKCWTSFSSSFPPALLLQHTLPRFRCFLGCPQLLGCPATERPRLFLGMVAPPCWVVPSTCSGIEEAQRVGWDEASFFPA